MDPTIRLRIATRIHFALLRHFNEDVSVSTLLRGEAHAREALWVCEASGHDDLVKLGKQFTTATRQEARAARLREQAIAEANATKVQRGATPTDLAWSKDTSGFGLSRPLELHAALAVKSDSWLRPSNWLRRPAVAAAR